MIILDDVHLLMIEPQEPPHAPVDDVLTRDMQQLLDEVQNIQTDTRFRGWHTCVCGERSDNREWKLKNGIITNSLAVHYLRFHRPEVPVEEINKLRQYAETRRQNSE